MLPAKVIFSKAGNAPEVKSMKLNIFGFREPARSTTVKNNRVISGWRMISLAEFDYKVHYSLDSKCTNTLD